MLPWLAAVVLLFIRVQPVQAHEGPPYPIVVDKATGPFLVSVWTDPDIGTGTFFVVLEPLDGEDLPENIEVRVGVAPVSGRLDQVFYQAESQKVRYGARYLAEVAFDQGEWWDVEVIIDSAAGGGTVTSQVEATPDGSIGPIGMVVYLLPFLAVGFLWLKAVLRQRQAAASKPSD